MNRVDNCGEMEGAHRSRHEFGTVCTSSLLDTYLFWSPCFSPCPSCPPWFNYEYPAAGQKFKRRVLRRRSIIRGASLEAYFYSPPQTLEPGASYPIQRSTQRRKGRKKEPGGEWYRIPGNRHWASGFGLS